MKIAIHLIEDGSVIHTDKSLRELLIFVGVSAERVTAASLMLDDVDVRVVHEVPLRAKPRRRKYSEKEKTTIMQHVGYARSIGDGKISARAKEGIEGRFGVSWGTVKKWIKQSKRGQKKGK